MRLHGVRQVAQFNWPKLLGGVAVTVAGIATWRKLPLLARATVAGAAVWTPLSLAASWWVYDHSPLHHWRFFDPLLPATPRDILLVVAGFDEVSPVLREAYPGARITIIDVVTAPEASVRRAKRWYPSDAPVVDPHQIGDADSADLVLFAQSAHEIRDPIDRRALFASARAVTRQGGRIVVVEHVRDLANTVAFGPGTLHFQSERTWLDVFVDADLDIQHATTVTPLVRCWVLAGDRDPRRDPRE